MGDIRGVEEELTRLPMAVPSSCGAEGHNWLITFWRCFLALMIQSSFETGGREMVWWSKFTTSDVQIAPIFLY